MTHGYDLRLIVGTYCLMFIASVCHGGALDDAYTAKMKAQTDYYRELGKQPHPEDPATQARLRKLYLDPAYDNYANVLKEASSVKGLGKGLGGKPSLKQGLGDGSRTTTRPTPQPIGNADIVGGGNGKVEELVFKGRNKKGGPTPAPKPARPVRSRPGFNSGR